ncbi:MAG: alpha/beta fold hydrolase [Pseudobdellovibrionaceae bacterium]
MNYLLLGALGRSTKNWENFSDFLKREDPTANVHFLDLPGYGDEKHVGSPASIHKITNYVRRKWLKLLQHKEGPWCILCISLGGMVALNWMGRYPKDFKAGVLINTSSARISPPKDRLRPSARKQVFQIMRSSSFRTREANILKLTSSQDPRNLREIYKNRVRRAHAVPITTFLKQLLAAALYIPPKIITTPLLFLASEKDKMVNPVCSRDLAFYYSCDVHVHPTGGHELQIDDPAWVAKHTAQFCTSNSSSHSEKS